MASFRARARTVDLLGRQQIAGIPTAISELFKNAHDAYATRVEADFFRERELLVLRDDGLGMTAEDFTERWLTLGTESKVSSRRGVKPPPALARQKRPILGEKGIGRLAIAAIGPQVLVLTRALRERRRSDLTVALVNWRLFEIPGLNLGEIEVPMLSLPGGQLPGRAELDELSELLEENIAELGLTKSEAAPIRVDLKRLAFDPGGLLRRLKDPSLASRGHGTQFMIVPTREQLAADIDAEPTGRQAPPLVTTLIGFSNTMSPGARARIATAFRDRKPGEPSLDLIAPQEFFTPEDFHAADHQITGSFDEMGDFHGAVQIYGGEERPFDFVWAKGGRRALDCGPFEFQLAYVQGDVKDSRLDLGTHARLTAKLDRIGGVYIYRDGIRVQPYGDPSVDFLEIERRRTENIGRAFFSYRRMFGVVEIDHDRNAALEEKAGREGFVQNRAYRQFRSVLMEFFAQLAAEFFTERGAQAEEFFKGREEARRRRAVRAEYEKRAKRERERFARRVGQRLRELDEGRPSQVAETIVEQARSDIEKALKHDGRAARERLLAAERRAQEKLATARARYALHAPPGIGLPPRLRADWDALQDAVEGLAEAVWNPAAREVGRLVAAGARKLPKGPTRRERLALAVDQASREAVERAEEATEETEEALANVTELVGRATRESQIAVNEAAAEAREAAAEAELPNSDSFVALRIQLEELVTGAADREESELLRLASRLRRAAQTNGAPAAADPVELAAALDEELLALREAANRDLELAQLGMATEVISHELDRTIVGIRESLRRLSAYADVNQPIKRIYRDIRTGFDHLDNYLGLFTPLQRRLTRRRAQIKGFEIAEFIEALFTERFTGEEIELRVTDAFRAWRGKAFRSTVYPVFVNLVDNAAYWVIQGRRPRWIELDARGDTLYVSDSGPGIPERDHGLVWQFGFTRKPGGRGAGLHISREVLARDGWEIALVNRKRVPGASFRIRERDEKDQA